MSAATRRADCGLMIGGRTVVWLTSQTRLTATGLPARLAGMEARGVFQRLHQLQVRRAFELLCLLDAPFAGHDAGDRQLDVLVGGEREVARQHQRHDRLGRDPRRFHARCQRQRLEVGARRRHHRHHRAQRVGALGGRRQQDDARGQPRTHDHGGRRAQACPHQVHVVEGVAHPHRPRLLLLGQDTAHDRAGKAVRTGSSPTAADTTAA